MPVFSRDVIEHEIVKHLDLNPSKFELSKKDESEAAIMASAKGQAKTTATVKRQMKMERPYSTRMIFHKGITIIYRASLF